MGPFSYAWGFVVPHAYGGLRIVPGTESLAMGLRCLGSAVRLSVICSYEPSTLETPRL